jgi:hypothetical protein
MEVSSISELSPPDSCSTPKKGENKGNLRKVGVTKNECTARKREMYKIHRNISLRMCKLKKSLEKEQNQVKSIKKLLEANTFDIIEKN